jgi:preprotein translocase SecE subunit
MSVAEKPVTETPTRSVSAQLALQSLLGGAFLLVSLWLVLAGVPLAWSALTNSDDPDPSRRLFNVFLNGALQLIVTGAIGVGLGYLGVELEKKYQVRGLREGSIVSAVLLYIAFRLTLGAGNIMFHADMGTIGIGVTALIGAALVFGLYTLLSLPGVAAWLERMHDRGWYHTTVYKGTQGVKTRRMTVIALLAVGFWGIITLVNQRVLGYDRPNSSNDWYINIPFAGTEDAPNTLPLMFKIHIVVPILLGILLVWFAWRVVNLPTFGDFLIATEAEMNKVSWTTRKRLFQDTIVVLVTLFIMTMFLFIVDILWIKILSNEWIYVLQLDTRAEKAKLEEKARW